MSAAYLEKILKLCTPEQLDFYNRLYPNGPTKAQQARAIQQVEQTIINLNRDVQQLRNIKTEFELFKLDATLEVNVWENKLNQANARITELERDNNILKSATNPIIAADMARLDKLYRLEAAGVDNWEGYGYAMSDDEDD